MNFRNFMEFTGKLFYWIGYYWKTACTWLYDWVMDNFFFPINGEINLNMALVIMTVTIFMLVLLSIWCMIGTIGVLTVMFFYGRESRRNHE